MDVSVGDVSYEKPIKEDFTNDYKINKKDKVLHFDVKEIEQLAVQSLDEG